MKKSRMRKLSIVLIAAAALSAPALGQGGGGGGRGGPGGGFGFGFGGGGMMRQFEPSVNTEQMEQYVAMLGLSADQKAVAMTLFEGYQSDFNAKSKIARDKMDAIREEFRNSGDPSVWRDAAGDMDKFRTERKTAETAFFNDFKAVLSPEQAEKWPALERMRTRETTMPRGMMSGERADVIRIVDGLKLTADERASLNAVLDQYESDLDRELQNRNKVYDESEAKMREMFQNGGGFESGGDEMQKIITEGREASVRVRDINRRYARMVEESLPESYKAAFDETFRRESYPRIYGRGTTDRFFEAVNGVEGLDATQKESIAAIKESYDRDIKAINIEMEQATEEEEMNFTPDRMFGGGGDSKMSDLRDRRRELSRTTTDKVKELLTEEQRAKIPADRPADGEEGGPRQRRMRDRGGDGNAPPPEERRPANRQNS